MTDTERLQEDRYASDYERLQSSPATRSLLRREEIILNVTLTVNRWVQFIKNKCAKGWK